MKWAEKGYRFCKRHNNFSRGRTAAKMTGDMDTRERVRFYNGRLGPKLKAYLNDCLANPENDQLSLLHELALMRDIVGMSIALYDKSAEKLNLDDIKQRELFILVASQMKDNLHDVRIMAESAARIRASAKETFSIHNLHDVVNQVTQMVRSVFGRDEKGLRRFERLLDEQLRLPKMGINGTTLTPDQDVLDMDELIPDSVESAQELLDPMSADFDDVADGADDWVIEDSHTVELIAW
jgi:hypothetical protein